MTAWLLDTLVATSALLLLVLAARGIVARHFGPIVAYWLWLLPAARLFMPSLTREISVPAASGATSVTADAAMAAPLPVTATESAMVAAPAIDWTGMLIAVWLGGAALLFIVQMIRYVALRDELLADAREIDRIGNIKVVESDRIGGPLAFGLFSRYIAVPDHFTRTFSPEERNLALTHELEHHRSGDLFANLAAFTFLCLQWFNPLAWMAWSAFRFDQEAACDARVLSGSDVDTRQHYGRALARAAASDRLPTLAVAMAQNSPRNIIERLRRLRIDEASKTRRTAGRLAVMAATVIALPLTATVVPVYAHDEENAAAEGKTKVRNKKVIVIRSKDGKDIRVDVSGDADTPFVKTIKKDGKTIILHSSKELSEAEVEKMVADAEASRAEAEASWGEAEAARGEAEAARGEAEAARGEAEAAMGQAEAAMAEAQANRAHALAFTHSMDFASMIPEIEIREFRGKCTEGYPVSTQVQGFDGKNKSRIRMVMCGKAHALAAKKEAIKGLREARKEIAADEDVPDNIRKSILDSLKMQIDRMERQLDKVDNEEKSGGNEV